MAFRIVVFAALLFAFLGFLVLVSLPRPNILVSADIRSDTIEMEVLNPSEAEFVLPKATLMTADDAPCLEDILVRPGQGSAVIYTLEMSGDWYAAVDGEVSWRDSSGRVVNDPDGVVFALSSEPDACRWSGRLRLPIAGSIAAGLLVAGNQEAGEELLPLIEGDLTVYGRATERIFWIIPLSLFEWILPLEPGRLYYADTFKVPSGSRMQAPQARWWGFVDISVEGDAPTMWLRASTNAPSVQIFAPAPKQSMSQDPEASFEADQVSLTLATRIGNDPNLRWLFAIASFLLVLVGLIAQAYSLRKT